VGFKASSNVVQAIVLEANGMSKQTQRTHEVLIIGAGFSGLGSAIRLRQNGVTDVVILERAEAVGGTWRDNQYPGAACDIPSNLYSYSFVKNPEWRNSYAGSKEILAYIKGMVAEYQIEPLIRFRQNVVGMAFDQAEGVWNVAVESGDQKSTVTARSVVMAQGPLSTPGLPNISGIKDFAGKTIHSAAWDHGYDYSGKKVAVIGTGASAVQIIPELVKTAASVKVFQRTPGWVLPRPDFKKSSLSKAVFRKFPKTQSAARELLFWGHESMAAAFIWDTPASRAIEKVARRFLKSQVNDPWLRRQLTPEFKIGCKRVLVSNEYYKALQADNTQLITWPIDKLSKKGIRTSEGLEHAVDCVVFATGFEVHHSSSPFPVIGVNRQDLGEAWAGGAKAYKSVSVSGFPNLFLTFGPNSGPGHNSALVYIEAQIDYIVQGVKALRDNNAKSMDVRADVQQSYNKNIQKRLAKTNWNSGCSSWYLTEDGFNATMYPGFATQYQKQMKHLKRSDYDLIAA
jgi:cation diffusion facilitator CzcD-associated flavoprotein CzcO